MPLYPPQIGHCVSLCSYNLAQKILIQWITVSYRVHFVLFLIEVWLIYSIVLVSGVWQSDSVVGMYMCVCVVVESLSCVRLFAPHEL